MNMRERIAKAICNRHGRNYDAMLPQNKDWWREEADAVLEAMREPTTEQLEAARNAPVPAVYLDSNMARQNLVSRTCWQAMIDAARQ